MSLTATLITERRSPNDIVVAAEVRRIVRSIERRVPSLSHDEIEAVVEHEIVRFSDARVRQFVPILVERAALSSLRPRTSSGE